MSMLDKVIDNTVHIKLIDVNTNKVFVEFDGKPFNCDMYENSVKTEDGYGRKEDMGRTS